MNRASAWLVVVGAVTVSCERPSPPVSLRAPSREYAATDYDRKFEQWSRSGRLVRFPDADARLYVDATFLSADFRAAWVARFARDATLSPDERQTALREANEHAASEHEFFVALETQRVRWGELNRRSSAWRLRLVDDRGRQVEPARIEPMRRVSAEGREYFSYVTPWRQVFRVRFPRQGTQSQGQTFEMLGPGTRYFILRISGVLGTVDLRWDVAESG